MKPTTKPDSGQKLTEPYVQKYYDDGLKNISESYVHRRWFASKKRFFDYNQTKRALKAALGNFNANHALEIGPGDAVWTKYLLKRAKKVDLLEQSSEMLKGAKESLQSYTNVSFIHANAAEYGYESGKYDLIQTVRCVEYVVDKDALVERLKKTLVPGGKLVIITKNPNYRSLKNWNKPLLHTEQIGRDEWVFLFKKHEMEVEAVYPAVMRWLSSIIVFRLFFDFLHIICVITKGYVRIPFLTDVSTESYTYVVRKKPVVAELFGVSGSGKTTLAKKLEASDESITRFAPARRGAGLVSFVFHQPNIFFSWLFRITLNSFSDTNNRKIFRHRVAILLSTFEGVGNVSRSKNKRIAILDEGLVQRVNTIYERKMKPSEFVRLLRSIQWPDLIICVDRDEAKFQRYKSDSTNPRAKLGDTYIEDWFEMVGHNHKSILAALDLLGVPTLKVTAETLPGEVSQKLREL